MKCFIVNEIWKLRVRHLHGEIKCIRKQKKTMCELLWIWQQTEKTSIRRNYVSRTADRNNSRYSSERWSTDRHLVSMTSYQTSDSVNRCVFTWRTILPGCQILSRSDLKRRSRGFLKNVALPRHERKVEHQQQHEQRCGISSGSKNFCVQLIVLYWTLSR